ncbi:MULTISPECIES: (2,3-dihydroxybenzoyl)adenylate synthase [unclassified Aeromicrobium]|uniref:(2,3-dihydroxybenzoyl)adenylate synthase n=1 Tax=unclassified Aeromicrobium TaxID=2633570 RepID=UPI00396AFD94
MRSPLAPVRSWPDDARQRYRDLGLWTDETFADFVADRTARFAGRTALVGRDAHGVEQRWTYADLGRHADGAAARLAEAGVDPGDRVVVALPNVVEFGAVVLGLFRLGALPVFALPTHREAELSHFCDVADAAALVLCGTDTDAAALHRRVAERTSVDAPALVDVAGWDGVVDAATPARPTTGAEDVAFLQLSGGTTGLSKLIPRTAADYLYSVRESATICGLDASSVMLVPLPVSHNFAMSSPGVLGVWHVGGCVVLARDPSPRTAFGLIERDRVDIVPLVPPLAQAWISAARRRAPDLSSLRLVQIGGARLSDAVAAEVQPVLHGRLQQVFGMAEGLVNYTRDEDPDEIVLTTQGRPISEHDEVRVDDDGRLQTRGPYTIRGYYRAEAADRDSFTEDGFYRTGDLVRRLTSGHLVVTGREKDQINRGGEKIGPDEIETPLLAHADVLDAVAVGLPDDVLGERICVAVRIESGRPEPTDLADHLRASGLATHKLPDEFRFVDALPGTHVGKNSRRDLRRVLARRWSA